ncbi:FkbM family methyltransferase [Methylophaga sp.]|uniref:FkbM family methyltransferase n=1 Tax=Methylophaga sp. TaxID=2024840 RepID=UPI003A948AC4
MYIKTKSLNKRLRNFAFNLFNALENNNNAMFDKNGEKNFLNYLISRLADSDGSKVVFDIGANIGEYSSMLLHIFQNNNIVDVQLHLFEPTQSCFEVIKKKFETKENFHLNKFGASDKQIAAKIFYDKEQSGLASLYQRNLDSYNLKLDKSEEINLRRMDDYIVSMEIKHIDFIKIDIEGHELKAFEGFGPYLNSDFVDYIQFEYGGANLDSHTSLMKLYRFLNDRGFIIAKVMPKSLEIRDYKPFMDNFMYANYVAISNRLLEK